MSFFCSTPLCVSLVRLVGASRWCVSLVRLVGASRLLVLFVSLVFDSRLLVSVVNDDQKTLFYIGQYQGKIVFL